MACEIVVHCTKEQVEVLFARLAKCVPGDAENEVFWLIPNWLHFLWLNSGDKNV